MCVCFVRKSASVFVDVLVVVIVAFIFSSWYDKLKNRSFIYSYPYTPKQLINI